VCIGHAFPCYREGDIAEFYERVEIENSHFFSQRLVSTRVTAFLQKLSRTVVTSSAGAAEGQAASRQVSAIEREPGAARRQRETKAFRV